MAEAGKYKPVETGYESDRPVPPGVKRPVY
jgi:hypothetical protein